MKRVRVGKPTLRRPGDERGRCVCRRHIAAVTAVLLACLLEPAARALDCPQTGVRADPYATTSVGYVKPGWSGIVLLPGLSLYPGNGNCPIKTEGESGYRGGDSSPDPSRVEDESGSPLFPHPGGAGSPTIELAPGDGKQWPVPRGFGESGEEQVDPSFRSFMGTGISIDPFTEDIWFGDYCRKRIGRLRALRKNLALGQSARQSSTSGEQGAGRAVDGNVASLSVAQTTEEDQSWWEVDLGKAWRLDRVELWDENECGRLGLSDLYVMVSDVPFEADSLAEVLSQPGVTAYGPTRPAARPVRLELGLTGRYVRVQLTNTGKLALAEATVLGGPLGECTVAGEQLECRDDNVCTDDSCSHGRCEPVCAVGEVRVNELIDIVSSGLHGCTGSS